MKSTSIGKLVQVLQHTETADQKKIILQALNELIRRQYEKDNELIGEVVTHSPYKTFIFKLKKLFRSIFY